MSPPTSAAATAIRRWHCLGLAGFPSRRACPGRAVWQPSVRDGRAGLWASLSAGSSGAAPPTAGGPRPGPGPEVLAAGGIVPGARDCDRSLWLVRSDKSAPVRVQGREVLTAGYLGSRGFWFRSSPPCWFDVRGRVQLHLVSPEDRAGPARRRERSGKAPSPRPSAAAREAGRLEDVQKVLTKIGNRRFGVRQVVSARLRYTVDVGNLGLDTAGPPHHVRLRAWERTGPPITDGGVPQPGP